MYPSENTIVELIDLHKPPSVASSGSYSHLYGCVSLMKEKLRNPINVRFSGQMNLIHEIKKEEMTGYSSEYLSCYHIVFLYDRGLILLGSDRLHLFSYVTKKYLRSISLGDVNAIHEMVVDGNFLYIASGSRCFKLLLNVVLDGDNTKGFDSSALLWKSSPDHALSNSWGLALLKIGMKTYAYVMDYGLGVLVFDSETGKQVPITIPKINTGYGIAFTEENEMIISTSDKSCGPIQIYTFDKLAQEWKLARQAKQVSATGYNTPYGIYYEKQSQLIYLIDTFAYSVFVFRKHDLELVNTLQYSNHHTVYGIVIDSKRGELYLPICDHSITIFR